MRVLYTASPGYIVMEDEARSGARRMLKTGLALAVLC